jgi:geranylgeranyl diphosphate synthase, type I
MDPYLTTAAQDINQEIEQYIENCRQHWQIPEQIEPVIEKYFDSLRGGKRIRGSLVKLGYELMGGVCTPDILTVASAFEIVHAGLLTHDDIIDKSPLRRGKPSIYAALGNNHYGISQAICIGDLGLMSAIQQINSTKIDSSVVNTITEYFSGIITQTILGEAFDIALAQEKKNQIQEKDILTLYKEKTARYTITGPLVIGALLGGAKKEMIQHLQSFGNALGIAFQIQDDILGIFGTEATIGKSVVSDITEGKNTLIIAYAFQHATNAQHSILNRYYGKKSVSENQVNLLKNVLVESGALHYAKTTAQKYKDIAVQYIPQITQNVQFVTMLNEFVDFIVQREV